MGITPFSLWLSGLVGCIDSRIPFGDRERNLDYYERARRNEGKHKRRRARQVARKLPSETP